MTAAALKVLRALRRSKRRVGRLTTAAERAVIGLNRMRGRAYIPHPRRQLYIETSGICNLKCRFCAYTKKTISRETMPMARFESVVEQATAMGYREFGLTPTTGDVFFDREFLRKLEYLEANVHVDQYHFYTNFVLPDVPLIEQVTRLRKLSCLTISIYGHDLPTFVKFAGSNEASYRRLVRNLEALSKTAPGVGVMVLWRTEEGFSGWRTHESDLCKAVLAVERVHQPLVEFNQWFDNWGGLVSDADVADLGISLTAEREVPKNGACSLIFGKNQIMADGTVNACACRDANATLAQGHVDTTPLAQLLSTDNPAFAALIERQQQGRFDPVCASCTFYRSIYKPPLLTRRASGPFLSMEQFEAAVRTGPRT